MLTKQRDLGNKMLLRRTRQGVSLLEVLVSIGVTSIGLLGVLALMPLAGANVGKGQVAARAAWIGNGAISELKIRGGLNPRNWLTSAGQAPIDLASDRPRAFCIDPRGVAQGDTTFPKSASAAQMTRITLANGTTGGVMNSLMADYVCMSQDDLTIDVPRDRSLPPAQVWSDARRQSDGSLTWMATIAPRYDFVEPFETATTGIPRYRDLYRVSVVVFNRRVPSEEYNATVEFTSGGIAGGDARLTFANANDAQVPTPSDSWLMVSGMLTITPGGSSAPQQLPVFQWYRVLSAERDALNSTTRYVTLDGPNWDWDTQGNANAQMTNVQATIIPGTVAVYEKTLRLELSSPWNN